MKEFFQKKAVIITEAALLVAGAVGLTLSGATIGGITATVELAVAAVAGITAVIKAISAFTGK